LQRLTAISIYLIKKPTRRRNEQKKNGLMKTIRMEIKGGERRKGSGRRKATKKTGE
jgi:hypothetical protein